MAEPLKTKGRDELAALKKRVIRQYANGAIYKADQDVLVGLINDIEAHIINMPEQVKTRVLKRYT